MKFKAASGDEFSRRALEQMADQINEDGVPVTHEFSDYVLAFAQEAWVEGGALWVEVDDSLQNHLGVAGIIEHEEEGVIDMFTVTSVGVSVGYHDDDEAGGAEA